MIKKIWNWYVDYATNSFKKGKEKMAESKVLFEKASKERKETLSGKKNPISLRKKITIIGGVIGIVFMFVVIGNYLSKDYIAFNEELTKSGELYLEWKEKRGQKYYNVRINFYFQDGNIVNYQTNQIKYGLNNSGYRFTNMENIGSDLKFSTPINKGSYGLSDWSNQMKASFSGEDIKTFKGNFDTLRASVTITESTGDLDTKKSRSFDVDYEATAYVFIDSRDPYHVGNYCYQGKSNSEQFYATIFFEGNSFGGKIEGNSFKEISGSIVDGVMMVSAITFNDNTDKQETKEEKYVITKDISIITLSDGTVLNLTECF